MKKIIGLVLLVALFTSCKKDDEDSNTSNSISANIGGTNYVFNQSAKAFKTSGGGSFIVSIVGLDGVSGTANSMNFGITSNADITTTVYSETSGTNNASGVFSQNISSGNQYVNANSATNPFKITVTAVNSTSIQGTFEGDLFLSGPGGAKKTITNGKFNVPF